MSRTYHEPSDSIPARLEAWQHFRSPAGVVLIAALTVAVYLPSLHGRFLLDDDKLLTQNDFIQSPDGLYRFWLTTDAADYWPATSTSFWLEWRLWGLNSTGYHVTNLLLHIVSALLIWRILQKLSIPGAFLAALLFAVHPVNVESVAWISQRKNTLAMLFFLLSILWYLRAEGKRETTGEEEKSRRGEKEQRRSVGLCGWYWLSLLAFALAMLSKGSVAILPVLLLGMLWWQRRRITVADLMRSVPFFAIAVILGAVNIWFQTHGSKEAIRYASFAERLAGAGTAVWFYLAKALVPIRLIFVYPQWHISTSDLAWWLPLLAAVIVTAVLWRKRNAPQADWGRSLLFAWGFFGVALAPALGFTDVGFMRFSLVADHYQHIALIGVMALVAAGWSSWHHRAQGAARSAASIAVVLLVGALTLLTWQQNRLLANPQLLYQATLDNNPDCWLIHSELGLVLFDAGRGQEAIEHYRQALRLHPLFPEAENNLGNALSKEGRNEDAIEHFHRALALDPNFAEPLNNLAVVLIKTDKLPEAIQALQQSVKIRPNYADAHNNLGNALANSGRLQEALAEFQAALRIDPEFAGAHRNLGNLLLKMGRTEEAAEQFDQAMKFQTGSEAGAETVLYNLGVTQANAGRIEEAIEKYRQALQIKPDYAAAHNNLGLLLKQSGQLEEAIAEFKQVIQLQPNDAPAYNNLANTLSKAGRTDEAIVQYQHALQLDPNLYEAHYNLAVKLSKADRWQDAAEQFELALRLKPTDANTCEKLAKVYAQLQRHTDAIAAAEKGLTLARSQGQTELAGQIETWLNAYRGGATKN